MPDDISQDDSATADDTNKLFQWLHDKNFINTTASTIWEDTYGCADQYICATSFYLISILPHGFQIVID